MRLKTLIVILILFFAQTSASSNELTQFWEFSSGNWAGGAYKNNNGAFSHCYISANYVSGITMSIGLTKDNYLRMVLGKEEWNLPVNKTYSIGLTIDNRYLGQFQAAAMDSQMLLIEIGNRPDVFKRLRLGRELMATAAKQNFYFSLKGTNSALGKVKECVDLASALSGSKTNPFASDDEDPFSSAQNTHVNNEKEILATLLNASGLSDVQFVDPKSINYETADYAWVSEDTAGVFFTIQSSGTDVDEWSGKLLGSAATGCDGSFGSQSTGSYSIGNYRIKQFYAACRGGSNNIFIAATAVESENEIMFFMNFTPNEPTKVRKINENLFSVIEVLVTE